MTRSRHKPAPANGQPAQTYGAAEIRVLLDAVAAGKVSPAAAVDALKQLPFEELGFATLDHHRGLRRLFPEVIYCAGKTAEQVAMIAEKFAARSLRVLGTRATEAQYLAAKKRVPGLEWDALSRCLWVDRDSSPKAEGVAVLAAGTSDLPVAEEAARTLEVMGHQAERIYDVGVAGLHRLLHRLPALTKANVLVVVAGMEGALPSVVGGLVSCPIIAVPTSVGYGASFGGIAALLGMLNSCSPGVSVVNIDNGFGAGYSAATINHAVLAGAQTENPR
jgi:pyridinium-3,5-biscarboxylic acid mononucleotide synthase